VRIGSALCLALLGLAPPALAVPAKLPQPIPSPASATPLVLNEILAGPARDWDGNGVFSSRDDEWVEIENVDLASLDLTGWLITDGDQIPRYALSGSLAPGERRVIFGGDSYNWERANGEPAFGLSLSNSGDKVMLWKVTGADTVLMDSYAFGSHEAAADRSIGRVPDGTGSWALFDGLDPYTGTLPPAGNGCVPTPGTANVCGSTPVERHSWGRLKTLYR
jgi:hypothetical protein